ncbi:MAG: hypothetical protein IJE81_00800 [Oscillospiraceae bacterium]|nr:hypothetical protein [Oscillospiraceae bacterium]
MKSRTSSCKKTALRKDFGRFWPVWAGYFLALIVIQIMQSNSDMSFWYVANMGECIGIMGIVNCAYGLIVALMLFGDLFNTRMCYGLHSLPLRREQWFGVHVKAGLLFSLIPTAVMVPLSEIIILLYSEVVNGWQIPLLWFAAVNIQYVFFFGLAVFCVMCAGSRFSATVVYGIVNFASLLLFALADLIYTPLLYGVVTQSDLFVLLCPVGQIVATRFIDAERLQTGGTYIDKYGIEQQELIGEFTIRFENWTYILVLAVIGIVLLLLARRMYQKRALECAGDFLAVRWLEPVFQVVFSVLCMAGFYAVFALFFGFNSRNHYLLLVIGLLVGWFAGRMFLERSTRVFRLKNFLGLALLTAAIGGSLLAAKMDVLGISLWVPAREEIEVATIYLSHNSAFTTDDPEEIADILNFHEAALAEHTTVHPDYSDDFYNPYVEDVAAYATISYRMKNGSFVQREYFVLPQGDAGTIAREYLGRLVSVADSGAVKSESDFRYEMSQVIYGEISGHRIPENVLTPDFLAELTEAIIADCEDRSLIQSAAYHPEHLFDNELYKTQSVYLALQGDDFHLYLQVFKDSENTMKVLESTGIIDDILLEYKNAYG